MKFYGNEGKNFKKFFGKLKQLLKKKLGAYGNVCILETVEVVERKFN